MKDNIPNNNYLKSIWYNDNFLQWLTVAIKIPEILNYLYKNQNLKKGSCLKINP